MPVILLSPGESREFEAPVRVRVPGGAIQECRVTFAEQPADFMAGVTPAGAGAIDAALGENEQVLNAITRDWSGLTDSTGQALEHGAESMALVQQRPYVRNAIIDTYNDHINGRVAASSTDAPAVILLSPEESRDFVAPVTVRTPGEEGDSEISITYRERTTDVLAQIARDRNRISRSLLQSILVDWSGFEDLNEQPIPYSPATLDMVLLRPYLSLPIINTYIRQISGRERDLGNFVTAPPTGGAAPH